jgi:uncharacterized protein (PEP-CTERM system associated)
VARERAVTDRFTRVGPHLLSLLLASRLSTLGWVALSAVGSAAAQTPPARALAVTASLDTTVSVLHSQSDGGQAVSDGVLELRPGLQVTSRSGRVRGSLSYALDAIQHTAQGLGSSLQNSLNAAFTAEAVPNWAFVDASASITQQSLSAYGQPSFSSLQENGNRREVYALSLSPYVRGSLNGLANYEARVNGSVTNVRDSTLGDSNSSGGSLTLSSADRGFIGWSLSATRQRTAYEELRSTLSDRLLASLIGRPDPELTLTLRGGRESNDVLALERRSYGTYGAEVLWTPTPRTTVDLGADRRYFGDSHHVVLEHRLARSALRFTSSRDATEPGANIGSRGQAITAYQLLDFQYTSSVPDPAQRDQLVRDQLRAAGIDPNQVALFGLGPILGTPTLLNRQDLGWTYTGPRSTVSLVAFATSSNAIDSTAFASTDATYRQRGLTLTVAHRLTRTAIANFSGTDLRTLATESRAGSSLRSASLGLTDQLSRRVSASVAARATVLSGSTNPYRESSLSAAIGVRF